MADAKKVRIKALKAEKGKPQHMPVGKVYEVGEETAKILIDSKRAEKTSEPVTKPEPNILKAEGKKEGKKGEDLTN